MPNSTNGPFPIPYSQLFPEPKSEAIETRNALAWLVRRPEPAEGS